MNQSEMDIRRKDFFNDNADGWLDTFYLNPETGKYDRYEKEFARLFDLISLKKGDTVVDAGCGCGVLAPGILDRIGDEGRLYEVDYAEKMIDVNKKLHPDSRIQFLVSSIDSLDISCGSVDSAVCFSCFPHFQDKSKSLEEIKRVLRQGGQITIAHFDSSEGINDHHRKHECVMHDHLPDESEMRELLKNAGFRVETFVDESGFYCVTAVSE